MPDALVTLKLAPSEFDTIKVSLGRTFDAETHLSDIADHPGEKQRHRAEAAKFADLLAQLSR